jgi:hypothetical protein
MIFIIQLPQVNSQYKNITYINLKKSYNINIHKTSCVNSNYYLYKVWNRRRLISSPILFYKKMNEEWKNIKIINKEGRLINEIK